MRRLSILYVASALAFLASAALSSQEGDETVLGSASQLLIETDAGETAPIEAGTRLYTEPHLHAAAVTVVDVALPLPVLERQGDWVRVRFGERQGWAYLGEPPSEAPVPAQPEVPLAPEPPPPAEVRKPDPSRLARARALLVDEVPPVEIGPITIYTDVQKKRIQGISADVATNLPAAYDQRYRLSLRREAEFAVVIFANEESYREFEKSVADLPEIGGKGHAGSGVAALVAGQRTPPEVAALLVHELAHLLNRRAFEGNLPPWLEEGIANDLAYCRLDRRGRPQPSTLGGRSFVAEVPGPADRFGRHRFAGTFHLQGPLASLSLLKRSVAAGETTPLPELLDLTWREFVDPAGRELRYVQSTFLIRYLLDEIGGTGFRDFLQHYQAGSSGRAEELLAALGVSWDELTAGYEGWISTYSGRS